MNTLAIDAALWWPAVAGLGRGLMAGLFLYSAIDKMRDWSAGLAEVRAMGVPMPVMVLSCTVALQLIGGLMLLVGWHARWAAAALGGFTLVATAIAHPFWRLRDGAATQQRMTFAEHLAIVGGLLMVVAGG